MIIGYRIGDQVYDPADVVIVRDVAPGGLPRIIVAGELCEALAAAGIIEDLGTVTRFVIDAKGGEMVRIYVERVGDERLLQVAQTLEGIEISGVPAPEGSSDGHARADPR